MGAWGIGLYSSDFAMDLRAMVAAVVRLPFDGDRLAEVLSDAEHSAATDPADSDHTTFWLVLADQLEKRGVYSGRVREMALAILEGGRDAEMMRSLGMRPADLKKRAKKLDEVRERLLNQPAESRPRKTLSGPEPYALELCGVYAYPTCGGEVLNPYMSPKYFDRSQWQPDGFGLMYVIGRGRAFDFLPWYHAAIVAEVAPTAPDAATLVGGVRWRPQPIYGSFRPAHVKKMELQALGVFPVDPQRLDHFFPHRWPATVYAVNDISLAEEMEVKADNRIHRWRRPDGKLEIIAYPPPATIAEMRNGP